jgi:dolichol-phosphate mannosyltransferase
VAYGVRSKRHGNRFMVFLFNLFYTILNAVSDLSLPKNAGDFRLLDRKVLDVLKNLPERNLYLRGLVTYLGFRQAEVVYERDERLSGSSKFRLVHYLVLAVDALTAFSKTPLRIIGVVGLLMFLFSTLMSAYYLFGYLIRGSEVQGFTTLAILILGLQSITFIFLGIQSEYLSRIFDDAKYRPRVVIAEAVNAEDFPRVL